MQAPSGPLSEPWAQEEEKKQPTSAIGRYLAALADGFDTQVYRPLVADAIKRLLGYLPGPVTLNTLLEQRTHGPLGDALGTLVPEALDGRFFPALNNNTPVPTDPTTPYYSLTQWMNGYAQLVLDTVTSTGEFEARQLMADILARYNAVVDNMISIMDNAFKKFYNDAVGTRLTQAQKDEFWSELVASLLYDKNEYTLRLNQGIYRMQASTRVAADASMRNTVNRGFQHYVDANILSKFDAIVAVMPPKISSALLEYLSGSSTTKQTYWLTAQGEQTVVKADATTGPRVIQNIVGIVDEALLESVVKPLQPDADSVPDYSDPTIQAHLPAIVQRSVVPVLSAATAQRWDVNLEAARTATMYNDLLRLDASGRPFTDQRVAALLVAALDRAQPPVDQRVRELFLKIIQHISSPTNLQTLTDYLSAADDARVTVVVNGIVREVSRYLYDTVLGEVLQQAEITRTADEITAADLETITTWASSIIRATLGDWLYMIVNSHNPDEVPLLWGMLDTSGALIEFLTDGHTNIMSRLTALDNTKQGALGMDPAVGLQRIGATALSRFLAANSDFITEGTRKLSERAMYTFTQREVEKLTTMDVRRYQVLKDFSKHQDINSGVMLKLDPYQLAIVHAVFHHNIERDGPLRFLSALHTGAGKTFAMLVAAHMVLVRRTLEEPAAGWRVIVLGSPAARNTIEKKVKQYFDGPYLDKYKFNLVFPGTFATWPERFRSDWKQRAKRTIVLVDEVHNYNVNIDPEKGSGRNVEAMLQYLVHCSYVIASSATPVINRGNELTNTYNLLSGRFSFLWDIHRIKQIEKARVSGELTVEMTTELVAESNKLQALVDELTRDQANDRTLEAIERREFKRIVLEADATGEEHKSSRGLGNDFRGKILYKPHHADDPDYPKMVPGEWDMANMPVDSGLHPGEDGGIGPQFREIQIVMPDTYYTEYQRLESKLGDLSIIGDSQAEDAAEHEALLSALDPLDVHDSVISIGDGVFSLSCELDVPPSEQGIVAPGQAEDGQQSERTPEQTRAIIAAMGTGQVVLTKQVRDPLTGELGPAEQTVLYTVPPGHKMVYCRGGESVIPLTAHQVRKAIKAAKKGVDPRTVPEGEVKEVEAKTAAEETDEDLVVQGAASAANVIIYAFVLLYSDATRKYSLKLVRRFPDGIFNVRTIQTRDINTLNGEKVDELPGEVSPNSVKYMRLYPFPGGNVVCQLVYERSPTKRDLFDKIYDAQQQEEEEEEEEEKEEEEKELEEEKRVEESDNVAKQKKRKRKLNKKQEQARHKAWQAFLAGPEADSLQDTSILDEHAPDPVVATFSTRGYLIDAVFDDDEFVTAYANPYVFLGGLRRVAASLCTRGQMNPKLAVASAIYRHHVSKSGDNIGRKWIIYTPWLSCGTKIIDMMVLNITRSESMMAYDDRTKVFIFNGRQDIDTKKRIVDAYNALPYGQRALLVITNAGRESLDLLATGGIILAEPSFADEAERQILGRAVRRFSHRGVKDPKVIVFKLLLRKPSRRKPRLVPDRRKNKQKDSAVGRYTRIHDYYPIDTETRNNETLARIEAMIASTTQELVANPGSSELAARLSALRTRRNRAVASGGQGIASPKAKYGWDGRPTADWRLYARLQLDKIVRLLPVKEALGRASTTLLKLVQYYRAFFEVPTVERAGQLRLRDIAEGSPTVSRFAVQGQGARTNLLRRTVPERAKPVSRLTEDEDVLSWVKQLDRVRKRKNLQKRRERRESKRRKGKKKKKKKKKSKKKKKREEEQKEEEEEEEEEEQEPGPGPGPEPEPEPDLDIDDMLASAGELTDEADDDVSVPASLSGGPPLPATGL